ncbi:MAG TPA: VanZ family protein [Candidatus Polarisedimenticolia bacterium]|nr:VanZ family protein [Candidatus Polarisedimenticolia bacterium]
MSDSKMSAALEAAGQGASDSHKAATRPLVFHPWYGLATGLYMAGITLMSSMSHPAPRPAIVQYGLNLGHIPLFAGLTFLMIKTIAPKHGQPFGTPAGWWAALLPVTFAAVDEWHQSFVPGRSASAIDFVLDLMGIGAVLLFYRLSALVSEAS